MISKEALQNRRLIFLVSHMSIKYKKINKGCQKQIKITVYVSYAASSVNTVRRIKGKQSKKKKSIFTFFFFFLYEGNARFLSITNPSNCQTVSWVSWVSNWLCKPRTRCFHPLPKFLNPSYSDIRGSNTSFPMDAWRWAVMCPLANTD